MVKYMIRRKNKMSTQSSLNIWGTSQKPFSIFSSANSHTSEENEYTINDKDLIIDESEKELFFGYVLQLCHVIKFFGHFVETHNNKEENLKMIKKVYN